MNDLIIAFALIPLIGFFLSLLLPEKNEDLISWFSFVAVGLQFLFTLLFISWWIWNGHPTLEHSSLVLYQTPHYRFFLDFLFDKTTAVYLSVGALLTFMITIYSRYYMHREKGYKRFFSTILFFYSGYSITVTAGNIETLFVGWEILGASSFLLIAFYRDRYLPVKNAVKVFSVYRIGDVGLIMAMWATHHLFHENITFLKLSNYELVHHHLQSHSLVGVFIAMMILLSAAAKSAQLPFSSWLPRAMEGPTPSSAIFYGSLSVHLGVFLLIRTFPFWEYQYSVRVFIGLLGLATSLVATSIAHVQSSVKSQIAYASIAQIGIIFLEVAAGFETLALFHFAGNAFLRTYQLLVSPSVASYLIREQFYHFQESTNALEEKLPKKWRYTLYMLALKEWNLDSFLFRFLWQPLKLVGVKFSFLSLKSVITIFIPLYLIGLYSVYHKDIIPETLKGNLPYTFSIIGLIMVLRSFSERKDVFLSWILIMLNHFWVALAISFNENFRFEQVHVYLSGIFVFGIFGLSLLYYLKKKESFINLEGYNGYAHKHPMLAFLFFLACLGLTGFPISPTFIGEDLIFSHIHQDQAFLAACTALSCMVDGIAVIRVFARTFLGRHLKSKFEMGFRTS